MSSHREIRRGLLLQFRATRGKTQYQFFSNASLLPGYQTASSVELSDLHDISILLSFPPGSHFCDFRFKPGHHTAPQCDDSFVKLPLFLLEEYKLLLFPHTGCQVSFFYNFYHYTMLQQRKHSISFNFKNMFCCRSLGVHCSKVRSLTLDSWEPELLKVQFVSALSCQIMMRTRQLLLFSH